MSEGRKVPHAEALAVAKEIVDALEPYVFRQKVAGSLRRRVPEVSDIEIVCEPLLYPSADLFSAAAQPDVEPIRRIAGRFGTVAKGQNKYIQVAMPAGLKLDLFMVTPPANWWVILAIRTGPAKLSQWAVTRLHDFGLQSQDGRVLVKATGQEHAIRSEADFFAAAGLPCVAPALRDTTDALRPIR